MKTKRTREHNPDGTIIYNTFNSTGLTPQYKNTNSRFNTKYGTKDMPKDFHRDSCTIAGCGGQCCTSTILLSDISGVEIWNTQFDYGRILKPGGHVSIGSSTNPSDFIQMGVIEDIVISNTNDCIAIPADGQPPPYDCSGAFPINIEIMTTAGPRGCQNVNIYDYNLLYIKQPGSANKFVFYIQDNIITRVPGTSRVGAPYRAPLAGYRKSLDCCNYYQKGCIGKCYLKFGLTSFLPPGTPRVGDHVYYKTQYIGEVILVNLFPPASSKFAAYIFISQIFDPAKNLDCHKKKSPFTLNEETTLSDVLLQNYQNVTFQGYYTEQCIIKATPHNDIYKDPSVKSCGKDNRVCYNGRIRSGMQPKQQFCISYTKVGENSYKKHKKLLCPTDIGFQKPYSYSYSQYNKNRALNTYKRGLERNIPANGSGDTSCPPGSCLKSLYRKSAGNSCLNCNLTDCNEQTVDVPFPAPDISGPNKIYVYTLQTESGQETLIGTLTGVKEYTNGTSTYTTLSITLNVCNKRITNDIYGVRLKTASQSTSINLPSSLLSNISDPLLNKIESKAKAERKRMSRNSMTVWKPSNDKFKVQGAVTSGGRLERLKLDTIKSANSKCRKGQRCDKNGNGKGAFLAGKPRFDGWMYNAAHLERVWPTRAVSAVRYRPQPFGIPQLTYKGRSTRSNKPPPSWKPTSKGTYGLYQRADDHNIRAPGYGNKCVANCPIPDCVKPIGLRTFKEWVKEYVGTDTSRYRGNIKCYEPPVTRKPGGDHRDISPSENV